VIRIHYKDFSGGTHDMAGLHGRVERCPRGVVVCLLPGLTARQRRAVLRRLRLEASRGFGPALPEPQLTVALGVDRLRTAARIIQSIVRLHPAVTLLPSVFVVAMVTLFVVAAGDRPGLAPGTGRGFADAAAGGVAGVSAPGPRVTRVTVAGWTGATEAGGAGLGSGRRAVTTPAHHGRSKGKPTHRERSTGKRPKGPQAKQWAGLPAWAYTAHRPGPPDFAR
jgi:hypothetical protein